MGISEMEQMMGQDFVGEEGTTIEKTLDTIAERLAYRESIEKLMQMANVNQEERRKLSILYAINSVRLINSNTLNKYIFANLSLSVSVKGKSREEVLEMGKASTQHASLSLLGRIKGKMGFD